MAAFENRQFVTAAKFITKSLLFILLLGFIRRLEPKLNSEQKVENIYSSPRHIAKPPVLVAQLRYTQYVNGQKAEQYLLYSFHARQKTHFRKIIFKFSTE